MNLEHELRKALARPDPPEGFERSVMTRITSGAAALEPALPARRFPLMLPLAASLLLAVGAGYYVHEQQLSQRRRAEAERATEDVSRALQITSDALESVRAKLQGSYDHETPIHP